VERPLRPRSPIRRPLLFAALTLSLITAGLAADLDRRVQEKVRVPHQGQLNDLERWLTEVPAFVQSHADFVDDSFPNPPLVLLLLYPVTRLSPAHAQVAWAGGKAVFAILIFAACLAMTRGGGVELTVPATALVLGVWIWPVMGDIQDGQTNLLMLLPLTVGLWRVQKETASDDWAGGLLIALAVSIKVTPLIFVGYLAIKGRWRAVLASLTGLVLWLIGIPTLAFGWTQSSRWLTQWSAIMIAPYALHGSVAYVAGQSIPGILGRLLRHVPAFVSDRTGEPYYMNLADVSAPVVNGITRTILIVVALLGLSWMRQGDGTLRSRRYVMEIGAVASFMLWASERTWVAHYVSLVLPLVAVAMVFDDARTSDTERRWTRWILLGGGALMLWTSDLAKVFSADGRHYVKMIGIPLWVSLSLAVDIIVATRTPRPLEPDGASHPGPVHRSEGMDDEPARHRGVDQDAEPVVERVRDQACHGVGEASHPAILLEHALIDLDVRNPSPHSVRRDDRPHLGRDPGVSSPADRHTMLRVTRPWKWAFRIMSGRRLRSSAGQTDRGGTGDGRCCQNNDDRSSRSRLCAGPRSSP
jgi:hypothetical protein